MTKNSDLKKRIRARMKRTGERYTTARAHVLLARGAERAQDANEDATQAFPGVFPSYLEQAGGTLGGVQGDTALLARTLAHAGIVHPATGAPYSEAMLHGLCGGIGFLYAVFEYKGHAPMLSIVMRSRSMPETYLADVFDRVGAECSRSKTTSARVAAKALNAALDSGTPAICIVDLALLPYTHQPAAMAGMSPHYVGVIGAEGDQVWLDDRSTVPIAIPRAELDAARAGYKKAKHELFTVSPAEASVDWKATLRSALQDTVSTIRSGDPTVPEFFRVNCGLAGMRKWQQLLTDPKDKKGWPRVFEHGANALAGLHRAYDGIQHEYTPPRGGRPLYADFLDEAAELTGASGLKAAGDAYREAGERWHELAEIIAETEDAAVSQACHLADRRAEALDDADTETLSTALSSELPKCTMDAESAAKLYARMAEKLGDVIDAETRAVEALELGAAAVR